MNTMKRLLSSSNFLFTPSIRLMNRLKYYQKFLLISLVFILPITYMLWLLNDQMEQNIRFAKQEMSGLTYIEGTQQLYAQLQKQRFTVGTSLEGKLQPSVLSLVMQASTTKKKDFGVLEAAYKNKFKTQEVWNTIQIDWNVLDKKYKEMKPEESYERHTSLLESVHSLMGQAKMESGLDRDPDVDSFVLMGLTSESLPNLTEAVEQIKKIGSAVLSTKDLTQKDQIQLVIYRNQAKLLKDEVQVGIQRVSAYDEALGKKLAMVSQKNLLAMNQFIEMVDFKMLGLGGVKIDEKEFVAVADTALAASRQLLTDSSSQLHKLLLDRIDHLGNTRMWLLLSVIAVLLLSFYLFIAFYLSVSDIVKVLTSTTQAMAKGNLRVRMKLNTKDEFLAVGKAFNDMVAAFQSTIQLNRQTAEQVATSSELLTETCHSSAESTSQITAAIGQAAEGATTQMQVTRENAIALNEMSIGIQKIAETSSIVSEAAVEGVEEARKGYQSIQNVVQQIQSIHTSVGKSSERVMLLGEHSKKVSKIVNVITDIAKHTHLLSLNASIEAARAGVHGRGFAVVASEVSKLADMSKQSASQIQELISTMVHSTDDALGAMKISMTDVDQGISMINATGEVFGRIMNKVNHVAEQIAEVSAATEELSAGTEQISATMDGIVDICLQTELSFREVSAGTEEQTASLEEIAASAETLSYTANELQQSIRKFEI